MQQANQDIEYFQLISDGNQKCLKLFQAMTLANAKEYDRKIDFTTLFDNCSVLILDLREVIDFDSYLVAFINDLNKTAEHRNISFKIEFNSQDQSSFVALLSKKLEANIPDEDERSGIIRYFENIGNKITTMIKDSYVFIDFTGNLLMALFALPFRIKRMRWKDFPYYFNSAGVNAVPIVLLIVLLIGLITGYQGALQLKQFGADRFIADLIGISITRELAPLMTAILVAGRSGSSFAAEIGTMKVSEEIDALKTMGIDLYQFLILPRVLAVTLAIPFITILADLFGIAGGLIAALSTLNITFTGYINELATALNFYHILTGLGKSMIFGFLVASVGCFRGLQASGGAESVGKFTTAAVVTGVLLIILSDAVFTFLFQSIGI